MPSYRKQVVLPYHPDQMFELVSDIERYPEFLKWVRALRVSNPRDEGDVHSCTSEALVAFKGFTQTFSTDVIADGAAKTVEVRLVRGPLKRLENLWRFEPHGDDGTHLFFEVDYAFSSFILRALAQANHDLAVDRLMGMFLKEAKRRYG